MLPAVILIPRTLNSNSRNSGIKPQLNQNISYQIKFIQNITRVPFNYLNIFAFKLNFESQNWRVFSPGIFRTENAHIFFSCRHTTVCYFRNVISWQPKILLKIPISRKCFSIQISASFSDNLY